MRWSAARGLTFVVMAETEQLNDLDGPIAAPDHHRVTFENERVRVVETLIRPGDTTPVHTHLARSMTVVRSGSQFIRRDARGKVLVDTRAEDPPFVMPQLIWSDGIPAHTLQNTGSEDLVLTAIELKP